MNKKLLLEKCSIIRQMPANFDEMFPNKFDFIKTNEDFLDVFLLEINNAFVSPYGIVFKNGKIIDESVYSMLKGYKHSLTFYKKILFNKVRVIQGPCLIAHNLYFDNYYHWTLEALPRIFSVINIHKDVKIIIPEGAPKFVYEYLSFFEFKEIIEIKIDEIIKTDKIFLPAHTADGLRHNPLIINKLSKFIKDKVGIPTKSYPENVWISRSKSRYRQSPDEAITVSQLKEFGFENVNLEDFKLKEQIQLFSNIKILSGIHGAGFTNMLYMNSGQKIVDYIHKDHPDDAFYNLADLINVPYYFIQSEGTLKQSYVNNDDIRIDINKLISLLSI